ncbi:PQQ-dependent sugar dehydrogenase [Indiicoccus explosivorum]|uniref:PQQ-dependent sugar dehydrogenase n=1 Tax=Indiicoccus explosivorum TaxID=1917864 RepID=UPI000B448D81|nr:PQQ-dependent sugar dehydrogenase [Indiicoccus explosivorum]
MRTAAMAIALLLSSCTMQPSGPAENPEDPAAGPGAAVLAENLEVPWQLNKNDEGFFISERTGAVVFVEENGSAVRQPVRFANPLSDAAEAGFLGFVLKPGFDENREAFAYYVYEQDGRSFNKIVTLTLKDGTWHETDVHLDGVATGPVHHGGRLAISPDGTLFASIGDASSAGLAQDPDVLNGKILKMDPEGGFSIYSADHRNPQGFAWHEGALYASEHGQSANDEINRILEGRNYGWPVIEGKETKDGYETPFFTTGPDETWAPSGMAAADGQLIIATLRGGAIHFLNLDGKEVTASIKGFGRDRDVLISGDTLYFITNNTDGRGHPSPDDDKLIAVPMVWQ